MRSIDHLNRIFIVYTLRTTTGDPTQFGDSAAIKDAHKAVMAQQQAARMLLTDWGLPFESKSTVMIPKTLLPGFLKQMALVKQDFVKACESVAAAVRGLPELPDNAEEKIAAVVRDYTITPSYRTMDGADFTDFPAGMERLADGMRDIVEKRVAAAYTTAMIDLETQIRQEMLEFADRLSEEATAGGRKRSAFRITRVESLKLASKLYMASADINSHFASTLRNVPMWDVDRIRKEPHMTELIRSDAINIANA